MLTRTFDSCYGEWEEWGREDMGAQLDDCSLVLQSSVERGSYAGNVSPMYVFCMFAMN